MDTLEPLQLVFCAFVVTLAFAVRGGAGFGGGAIAVPLLALVLPLQVAVPAVTVLNMLSSIGHGVRDWRKIAWSVLLRMIPFTMLGVGSGLYLLSQLDPKPLAKGLGVFVILYAVYALVTAGREITVPRRLLAPLGALMSSAAGIIGTLFGGAAGPMYVIYLNALKLNRDVFRVTITTIMLFQGLTRLGGYAGLGMYNSATLTVLAAALPMMLIGTYSGVRIIRQFDQTKFNRVVSCVLIFSGLALILK